MQTQKTWIIAVIFSSSFASLLTGCGRDGPDRVVVSGTVALDGKPVSKGEIRFVPTKGTVGPVTMASIVEGRYRADANGGVPVATQRVEILAYQPDTRYAGQPSPAGASVEWPPRRQYLPDKYNSKSTLEMVVESGNGEIRKDFDLAK